MKRVFVAIDGSPASDRALEAGAALAKVFVSELTILHVEQGYLWDDLKGLERPENASIEEVLYSVSSAMLAQARAQASALGVEKIRMLSGLGDAVGFILETAKEEQPDIIVVGKRGRGRVSGLLIGSVSQKLVSLAPCKVLVVP